jgi:hypothetical protein
MFRFGWFDGIVQGRQEGEIQILETLVIELNQLGFGLFSLDIDGGRFSILAEDRTVGGEFLNKENVEQFLHILKSLPSLLKDSQSVESTLRATFVGETEVVETLFFSIRGEFQSLSKRRRIGGSDTKRDPSARRLSPVTRRAVIGGFALGALVLAWILFGAYKKGIFGRLLSPDASLIELNLGPLDGYLRVRIKKSWGMYLIDLSRGPKYPKDVSGFSFLIKKEKNLVQKAFFLRLQDGGRIWVFLLAENGKTLDSIPLQLAPLLQGSSARVEFPGRMGAKSLRLSLFPKKRKK